MTPPASTYRLQLRNGLSLEDAADIVPYLARLGIGHLYSSPLFAARPGSTHGYDAISLHEIDPAIGGEGAFAGMADALRSHGIGHLVDFVPNHMAAHESNGWWHSVLEWGPDSPVAHIFDIDWNERRLMLPILGVPYGEALGEGALTLVFDPAAGGFSLAYADRSLPLTPPSYVLVLSQCREEAVAELGAEFARCDPVSAEKLRSRLADLARTPGIAAAISETAERLSGEPVLLHPILEAQIWRIAYWRLSRQALTYRRFFEIDELVGLRVEDPTVFAAVHERLRSMLADGSVDGVRIDHIDGLADPRRYLERLSDATSDGRYIAVEKILEHGEPLRDWPVAGTTGYEFIDALAGLFVSQGGEAETTAAWQAFAGNTGAFPSEVRAVKRQIVERNFATELARVAGRAADVAWSDLATRDIGIDTLRRAIIEIAAALPVYRTYVNVDGAAPDDIRLIENAIGDVRATGRIEDPSALDFIARLWRGDAADDEPPDVRFAALLQQLTGPAMAKAVEDTVFYRYNRLIALNEVGGTPDAFGAPLADFHAAMETRRRTQPLGLSATATHDTKRGEDARTRLYTLSEMPTLWRNGVNRWRRLNARFRASGPEVAIPEPSTEWMFYQALAGAWPAEMVARRSWAEMPSRLEDLSGRMNAYMLKAVREAKLRTTWTAPDEAYESALASFVKDALDPAAASAFLDDFEDVCRPVWVAGALTGLSQLALKLAAPGIPDIYNGTELWDFSLVDPDNRRPVDFALRSSMLDGLDARAPEDLLDDWTSGAIKMRLLQAGLGLRKRYRETFDTGDYLRLGMSGPAAGTLAGFVRHCDGRSVAVVVPRLALRLLRGAGRPMIPPARWADTAVTFPAAVTGRKFRNVVTQEVWVAGEAVAAAEILGSFPVALLAEES